MTEVLGHPTSSEPLQTSSTRGSSLPTDSQEQQGHTCSLASYGGNIDNVHDLQPCYPDTPIEEVRRRYAEDGVVWVKDILDRQMVQSFRKEYLTFVNQGTGMLKEGTDPEEGIFSGSDWREFLLPGAVRVAAGLKDEGAFVDNAILSHRADFYQKFKDEVGRKLEPYVAQICGFAEPWCLPRSLLRCSVPNSDSTPVHYDQIFLRAGPPTSITAWVPIGDIDKKGGGLIYLDRAHDIGMKYEEDFARDNANLPDAERISAFNRNMQKGGWLDRNASRFGTNWSRKWLVGNYESGDVVFHTPYTVHAGATNESAEGRVRVSTDLRFVDKQQPYDKRWTILAYTQDDPNTARKVHEPVSR